MKALDLIKYMKSKNLKGQELANILNTTKGTISKIENQKIEKINMDMLELAAQYLNKSTAELVAELEKM